MNLIKLGNFDVRHRHTGSLNKCVVGFKVRRPTIELFKVLIGFET